MMRSIIEFVKLTPEQRASVFKKVFMSTKTGKYGDIIEHSDASDVVHRKYEWCKAGCSLISSGSGQFSGGYSEDIFEEDENTYHLFSFQEGDLYYYEKRVKTFKDFPDAL